MAAPSPMTLLNAESDKSNACTDESGLWTSDHVAQNGETNCSFVSCAILGTLYTTCAVQELSFVGTFLFTKCQV